MKVLAEQFGQWIIGILDFFYPPFKVIFSPETYRYAITGGMNLILDIILYFIFYHYVVDKQIVDLGFVAMSPHIAAFVFVFPITFSTGFFLAKFVTFTNSKIQGKKQLIRYAMSVGGSILLNYLLLNLFVVHFEFFATPSKIIITFIIVGYSYAVQKFFTFKTGKKQLEIIEEQA